MEAITVLFAVLIALVIYFLARHKSEDRVTRFVNKLPGPPSLPFIGTTYIILFIPRKDFFRSFPKRIPKYGPVFRSWLGSLPVVHVTTAENMEIILSSSVNITKSFSYNSLHPWLGDGLLTTTGSKWHRHRKLITPTFHFKILESFMEVFVEKSQMLVEQLGSIENGQVFDVYTYITNCTLDIICETAMGVEINAMSGKNNDYVNAIYGISDLIITRLISPWLHPDFIFYKTSRGKLYKRYLSLLHGFTKKVIDDRRKALQSKANVRNYQSDENSLIGMKNRMAFLDLLMEVPESGTILTDAQIREEVDTFMFEGHDTTTAAICWTLFLLGHHQDIQEEVYEEIENVFQGQGKALTISGLGELKVLERCIKEGLRLYPSVPIVGRLLTEDVTLENYLIPAGSTVHLHIFVLHRDEKYFPEPSRFDPDRFLPENTKDRHAFAYIPFSAGPRNCIGQKFAMYEEKTILAYILRNFKIRSLDTEEEVRPMIELVLRPLNGVKIALERRK